MPSRPIQPPWGGRSDSDALYEQPGFTTKSARNIRGRDPTNGRIRISQRAGLRKFNSSALGSGRVRALCSTTIDDRKTTYHYTPGAETVPWSTATPSKTDCLGVVTDRQGNVYALDGNAGIAKYNSAGHLLMKIALPVADPAHVVRALFVDDSDRIFAGVSAGGDVRTARVFCVLQRPQSGQVAADDPNQYFVLWQMEPGAYTEELKVYRGSQLYCAHNYTLERRSRVIVYEGIGLEPTETKRIESLAYPINGLDLLDDGTLYTVAPPVAGFVFRPCHPAVQRFNAPLIGWTPTDLTDAHTRIWAWYDAREIDETDVEQTADVPTLRDGQQILRWRDKSGNGRDFFAGSLAVVGEAGPTYVRAGIGGLPSVHFTNLGSVKQSLVTLPNPSIEAALASQQRSAVPTYKGSQFCLFILVRFSQDADAVTPSPRTILAQENEHATASDHVLFANRACQAPPLPGAVTAGHISYAAVTDNTGDAGQCPGPTPQALSINLNSVDIQGQGTALITVLWDGGVDPNDTGATRTRCLFRVNGRPLDRFEGLPLESLQPTWLGASPTTIFATGMDVARRLNGEIAEMVVLVRKGFTLTTEPKVLSFDALETGSPSAAQTDCELARIEAYIAYGWGCGEQLVAANAAGFNHFYSVGLLAGSFANGELLGPPAPAVGGLYAAHKAVLCADGLVTKHDSQGVLRAAVNMAFEGSTANTIGGIGYGVRARKIDSDGKTHVWTVGPDSTLNPSSPGNVALRKLIDLGASLSTSSADGAWLHKFTSNRDYDYQYPRMAADVFGSLYLPYFETGAAAEWSILVFKKDGSAGLAQILVDFLLSANQQAHAVAIPPDDLNPDYRTDLTTRLAELVYIATRNESVATNSTVHKLLLVTTTSDTTGSPRTIVTIGVSGADIKTIDATTIATPSGGAGAVDAASQYVEIFEADREIVVIDGLGYKVYSPLTGLVTTLEATSAGELPPRFKLGCMWRHRMILARSADKPGRYCGSAVGDIRDWDFRREPRLSTMAFDASLTRAGEVEDSIVALIPYSDDLLFVLGESRILRLTGDPQAGGQIDKITDDLGGSFGRSWCKDQAGRIFMWGNPPGLYLLTVDGLEPLTRYTIEDTEFATIDYSTHRVELSWDPIQKGVRIDRVTHAPASVVADTWFYEEKTHRLVQGGAIWTDRVAVVGKLLSASTFLAGDSTRTLLVGCEDGYIRMIDPAATDDDGSAIDSFVVLGPLNDSAEMLEWRLMSIQLALANDQSGCRLEIFGSEEAEDTGPILTATDLRPGLNDPFRGRVRGNYLWARLRSALPGRRWALERGEVSLAPVSKQINRST